jgi:hypothetical protein
MARHALLALVITFAALLTASPEVLAARGYDNCTGFVTSLPTTINTQGTWCLKQNLSTSITSGEAITIGTNNVTLDCNDFIINGLTAGIGTTANGVRANGHVNTTIRHCSIRGFFAGILLAGTGSGGHVAEDNRLDGNTNTGIWIEGDGSVIRRNRVFNTGGSTATQLARGIKTQDSVDVIDNKVWTVAATAGSGEDATGIATTNNLHGRVIGNSVRGLTGDGVSGFERGITNAGSDRVVMRHNDLTGIAKTGSVGIACANANGSASDNIVSGFWFGILTCTDNGDNDVLP